MHIIEATEITDEILEAMTRLIPQLSPSSNLPTRIELNEIVSSPSTNLFIARDPDESGSIVGILTLATYRIPTLQRFWIEDVVVDRSARGRGIGEKLVQAALEFAEKRGARYVDLTSSPSRESANRLYQRMGFSKRETNVYRYFLG